MAERVSMKRLENRVTYINKLFGRPLTSYTRKAGGKFKANIGNFHIDEAYGGVNLVEMANVGGGINNIGGARYTKRELDYFLEGMIQGALAKKGRAKNPVRKKRATKKKTTRKKNIHRKTYSIWKVVNGKTTGLATSLVFSSKASAQTHCREKLNKRGSYAIVNSRLTSVGVNKALAGKA